MLSTPLLKKIEGEVRRAFFRVFLPFLIQPQGKIVLALTNKRVIDKNNKTIYQGDEGEELS